MQSYQVYGLNYFLSLSSPVQLLNAGHMANVVLLQANDGEMLVNGSEMSV